MKVYNGLRKTLIDHNMQKKNLIDKIGISSTTIAKIGKGEKASLDVIERICSYSDCNIGEVISFDRKSISLTLWYIHSIMSLKGYIK